MWRARASRSRARSRSSSSAVGSAASVGVDHYLAAGQTGVAVRAPDHELAGGVDVQYQPVVEHRLQIGRKLCHDSRYQYGGYVVAYLLKHPAVGLLGRDVAGGDDEFVVLRGDDDGMHAHGASLGRVFNCHLAFGVGAQIGHEAPLLADGGELAQQHVAQVER